MAVLKDLIVHGRSRFLNGIQADSLKANTIDAKNGYFKYLKAIDGDIENLSVEELLAQKATVVGLLDVKGELHTNTWTNSNIANIGGVFYISPTVISTSANVVIDGNENSRTLTVSGGSFATTTVPTWNGTTESTSGWVIGSRVMVTGSVTYNNVEYPLGTCIGYISGALTSSGFTVQQISSEALESIFAITGTNSLSGTNIQISMYEIGPGNNNNQSNNASYKPVGILMTSYGMADKSTHIDIYGGVNAKNTNSKTSGMADPNVRIGHLAGLPNINGSAPTGWGIYTDNGYFSGVIVSTSGKIGGWTLGTSAIYNNTNSKTSTTAGTYLGTDAIRNYNSSTQYVHIESGKITAQGADITGEIKADTGRIGGTSGWTIASQQISSGSIGADNSMYLSTKNLAGTVAGKTLTTTAPSWRLTVGSNFGVDNTGKLYATGADISGKITVGSGSDLSAGLTNYSTTSQMNTAIGNATNDMATNAKTDWLVEVTTTGIPDFVTPSVTLKAIVYHRGVLTTSGFKRAWYKNGTGNSLGGEETVTVSDMDAYYVCIISETN